VARKQVIGFVLIALAILSLAIFLNEKNGFDTGGTAFPIDRIALMVKMFFCLTGSGVFLVLLTVGAFVFRKQKLIYWCIAWGITSLIVGSLASWEFILSRNPTATGWGALGQACTYYLTSIPLSQIAVLLAMLGWRSSHELRDRMLSWFMLLCLFLTSIVILLLILYAISVCFSEGGATLGLLGILANIVPLCITVPLALSILKKRTEATATE
jgi:hypothetical protein